MLKNRLILLLPYVMLPIAILSIQPYTSLKIANTTVWWVIQIAILASFLMAKNLFYDQKQNNLMIFISMYLIWNLFGFFHGIYMSEIYWDVKALLNNTFALLIPLFAYLATNNTVNQVLLSKFIKVGLPIFFLYSPFIATGSFGDYLIPISLLIFFIPLLPFRSRVIILFFAAIVITSNLGARSDVIKFSIPFLLLLVYYMRRINLNVLFGAFRLMFLFAPFILLVLALSGIFNPFAMNEYIKGDYENVTINDEGKEVKENLTADTRTAIYLEVLLSAKNHNSWLIGRSPARGNDTELFGDRMEETTGRRERNSNEVSILNIFTWTGIIGVFIYFLVFVRATFLAIHRSNNIFIKMIGIYLAFRWSYAWVEDFNVFNLNYLVLWMMIGMCMSESFRSLSNIEVKIWARGIFDKLYRKINVG